MHHRLPAATVARMWWVPFALAEDTGPTAARQCADAAAGSEVEVCLALVAEHPDQIDGIAAALRAHVDRAGAQDRELVQGLLLLQSDRGDEGARRLGELADPRGIGPLAFAAATREPRVGVAAATALGAWPAAIDDLVRIVDARGVDTDVRIAAAESLGRLGDPRAADALVASMRRKRVPTPLKARIAAVVRATWPDRAAEIDATPVTNGSPWLAVGGGLGLGYALEAVGYAGQVAPLAPIGAVSGGVAGVTAGWLAGKAWPIEAGDAAMITTSGLTGLAAGHLIGASDRSRPEIRRRIGGLTGAALGYGGAIATARLYDGAPADALEAQAIGLTTAAIAGSAFAFRDANAASPSLHGPRIATGLGLAVGTGVGHLVAPRVRIHDGDLPLIGMTTAYGAAFGALLPVSDTVDAAWLPVTTAGAGALTGYAIATAVDPRPKIGVMGTVGFVSGAGLAGGLAMIAGGDGDEAALRGVMLAGGTVGLGAGAWAAWRNPEPMQVEDGVLIGVGTAWALWQSVGWTTAARADYPTTVGFTLLAPSLVAAGLGAATPLVDAPVANTLAATSLGLWGGYVALVAAEVADVDPIVPALVGSDVGLAVGVLAMSPLVNAPPLAIALADAGGVLGGSLCALGASLATDDPRVILGVSLGGAGLGFAGGAFAGQAFSRHSRDIAWRPRLPSEATWSLAPAALSDRDTLAYGARLSVTGW